MIEEKKKDIKEGVATGTGATVALFLLCFCTLSSGGDGAVGFGNLLVGLALGGFALPAVVSAVRALLYGGKGLLSRALSFVVSLFLAAAALCVAVRASADVGIFASGVMELNCSPTLATAAVLAVGAFMASLGVTAIKKFAFAALAFAAISSVVLLLLATLRGGGAASGLYEVLLGDMFSHITLSGVAESFLLCVSPSVVAASFAAASRKRKIGAGLHSIGGVLVATVILTVCFINVALVPGLDYASSAPYPYVTAAGSVSVGKLFLRPEGFVYLSYLWTAITVVAVCISTICLAVKAKGRQKKILPYFIGVLALAVSYFDFIPFW